MAFDMSAGSKQEKIHYNDEDFLIVITREDGFQNLEWLWDNFYSSPNISSQRSMAIVSELNKAKASKMVKGRKDFIQFIERIIPFFQNAHDLNTTINCVSD